MSLLDYTHVGDGQEAVMPSDAALLALLPFGIARQDALSQYFSSERNGNRALRRLAEAGMLEEHTQTVQSPRRDYVQIYYTLTQKGMAYIAEKYWDLYPWLEDAVESIKNDSVSFLRGLSPGTIRSLLIAQACNVFFNLVGAETFLDRFIFEPEQALSAMQAHLDTTKAEQTTFLPICHAYRHWAEGLRTGTSEPVSAERLDEYRSRFFDAVELKIPDYSPYRSRDVVAPNAQPVIPERRERMDGHVGLLRTPRQIYVVYRSSRDGCTWNSSLIGKSWKYFSAQAQRLGLIAGITEAPNVYASILLVDGVGKKVSTFRRVVADPCQIRRKRDRFIGKGTSALYALPIVRECRNYTHLFLDYPFRTADWIADICKYLGDSFQCAPMGEPYPLVYLNQTSCYFGLEMNLHQINRTAESNEKCAIICLDWQAPYIRAAAADAMILVLDVKERCVAEYVECS